MEFELPKEEFCQVYFSLSTENGPLALTKSIAKFPVICPECTYSLVGVSFQILANTDKNQDVVGFSFQAICPNCDDKIVVSPNWFVNRTVYPKKSKFKKILKIFGY